jgi:adenylate cyclase
MATRKEEAARSAKRGRSAATKAGRKPTAKAKKPAKAATRSATTQRRKPNGSGNGALPDRSEILLSISNRLASHQTLDEQLETLMEITNSVLGCERGSLFLADPQTDELYSRVAQGDITREIRIHNDAGIAGHVFQTGESLRIRDAYKDKRFNSAVDEQTGFKTKSILCVPIRTVSGEIIGVAEMLNKPGGPFNADDCALLEAMTTQAAVALQSTLYVEKMERSREKELEFLGVVTDLSSELQLGPLLQKIMRTVTRLLDSERSTLFLHDERANELYTEVGEGLGKQTIRFPNHMGIAGTVFTTGESVNIPYAYADLRFNPDFDRQTGFFTRSILCVPVVNKNGKMIGVTQVLNKRGGVFTGDDEQRLKAFTAQISIGLENAKLFDDVQTMKNYNEGILESMSSGVITLDENDVIKTCNGAGFKIMRVKSDMILGKKAEEFFWGENAWVNEGLQRVKKKRQAEIVMDASVEFRDESLSVNVTIQPLQDTKDEMIGTMIMVEDISSEKRIKATMARYMDPSLADQLVAAGEEILGGQNKDATILFSDVRGFTTMTEELGAQGTVQLLNEYFTLMVDCIQNEGGMLDKFIGDAIMAVFGTPFAHEDDEDRALRCACEMMRELNVFNAARIARELSPIDMGIGLNSDSVVSGNIGSPKRMDYTVIGDGVNLAARLESACKQYAAHILISEFTFKRLRGTYRSREIDKVVVKGKTEPVGVHEILDYHTDESFPNLVDTLGEFKNGLEFYRAQNWDRAITSFRKAYALNPGDKLSDIYVGRCEHMKANPPGDDWNGTLVLTSK